MFFFNLNRSGFFLFYEIETSTSLKIEQKTNIFLNN